MRTCVRMGGIGPGHSARTFAFERLGCGGEGQVKIGPWVRVRLSS